MVHNKLPPVVKPSRTVLVKHKQANQAKNGKKMFEADELRLILDALSGKKMTTTTADGKTNERQRDRKLPNPVIRA